MTHTYIANQDTYSLKEYFHFRGKNIVLIGEGRTFEQNKSLFTGWSEKRLLSCKKVLPGCAWLVLSKTRPFFCPRLYMRYQMTHMYIANQDKYSLKEYVNCWYGLG